MSAVRWYGIALVVLTVALAAPVARAGNPHFVGGVGIDVDLQALEVTVSGKIAGLGNQDVVITLEVAGSADVFFANKGGNEAPGQNKAPLRSVATGVFRPDAKNGSVTFTLSADLGDALDALIADNPPPNKNWTTRVRNVQVTSIRLTVEQPAGNVVLQKTFTP